MNIEEYICPICREILIEPVTLPCKHISCLDCLEQTLDSNKYQCFMCRKFIGSWHRNAKRKKILVDEKLWKFIQDKFGDVVEKRRNGESIELSSPRLPTLLSEPGEIKREFEQCEEKILTEVKIEREKEDKLSEEFIKQLQDEENEYRRQQEELAMLDEELAKTLAEELNAVENVRMNDYQEQLLKDENMARTLEELERNSTHSGKLKNERMNDYQEQLLKDENMARTLEELERNSPRSVKLKITKPLVKNNREKPRREVPYGPMDFFIERKKSKV